MNFSVNQNRQFYVAKDVKDSLAGLTTVGDFYPVAPASGYLKGTFWGHQLNATAELVRTDLVKKKCILHANLTGPTEDALMLPTYTLAIASGVTIVVGTTYYVRFTIRDYYGSGDDTVYTKTVEYKAASATAATFMSGLKDAIDSAFSREYEKPFTITLSGASIIFTSTLDFRLGKSNLIPPTAIIHTFDEDEEQWGAVTETLTMASTKNSTKLAQLEYFCMGERGDQYRKVNFPYEIETIPMINPASTSGYYVLDIHYAYIGDGMENQASEKTLTIVTPDAATMKDVLDGWGIDDDTEWLSVSTATATAVFE